MSTEHPPNSQVSDEQLSLFGTPYHPLPQHISQPTFGTPALCGLCGRDEAWHEENQPKHMFNGSVGSLVPDTGSARDKRQTQAILQPPPQQRLGSDPVLRALLIRKGLVTLEEVVEIEEQLNRHGVIVIEAPDPAPPASQSDKITRRVKDEPQA